MNLFEFDKQFYSESIKVLAGADEVGRGPWAGPVVASVVIFPDNIEQVEELAFLNDSKKIPEKTRNKLSKIIKQHAIIYSICFVDECVVDELNILNATKLAIENCLKEIAVKIVPDILIIDGNYKVNNIVRQKSIVKGDAKSASIAAASIIAKVARDEYMLEMDAKYPEYGFAKHKGYGTKLHADMLEKHGPCSIHRKTFHPVSKFFSQNQFELF